MRLRVVRWRLPYPLPYRLPPLRRRPNGRPNRSVSSKDIIGRVNKAVGVALQAHDLRERIIADGFTPAYSTPEEYRKRFEKDVARWKDVVKKANIKIDVIG